MVSDTLFFISSIGVWIVIGVFMILYRMKGKRSKNFIFFLCINSFIFLLFSYIWFFYVAIDGISQVNGVFLYGIIALIITIIETLLSRRKGSSLNE